VDASQDFFLPLLETRYRRTDTTHRVASIERLLQAGAAAIERPLAASARSVECRLLDDRQLS